LFLRIVRSRGGRPGKAENINDTGKTSFTGKEEIYEGGIFQLVELAIAGTAL
jgi:hypothetical protein